MKISKHLATLINFFKKRIFVEREIEKAKNELLQQLNKELKIYQVVYLDNKGEPHQLELDEISLFEGVIKHCNNKEDFSSIKMIREKN